MTENKSHLQQVRDARKLLTNPQKAEIIRQQLARHNATTTCLAFKFRKEIADLVISNPEHFAGVQIALKLKFKKEVTLTSIGQQLRYRTYSAAPYYLDRAIRMVLNLNLSYELYEEVKQWKRNM